ncbi:kinase-like domain-containing protein [Schizophyllum commune]
MTVLNKQQACRSEPGKPKERGRERKRETESITRACDVGLDYQKTVFAPLSSSESQPPSTRRRHSVWTSCATCLVRDLRLDFRMLSTSSAFDLTFDDSDDWKSPTYGRLYRASSVGSYKVTSIGRGFDWDENEDGDERAAPPARAPEAKLKIAEPSPQKLTDPSKVMRSVTNTSSSPTTISLSPMALSSEPQSYFSSPAHSRSASPLAIAMPHPSRPPLSRTPTTPRPNSRRNSQQRVSLIAGRVSIAPIEPPPSPPPSLPPSLRRTDSQSSRLSAASTRAPSPTDEQVSPGNRTIDEFHIEGEIGRGAYGLVKRAREILPDGSLGPPIVIKQVIKSRILADCWKRHPKYGTIPIEIYVMSAISHTSYTLPPRRPWHPGRLDPEALDDDWVAGKVVKGHPNICPLLDYFEDSHYYYLLLPSSTPAVRPGEPHPPSDLFDLVESYPQGLPPSSIRTYLGQIADALSFLHSHGIVHRDVKDENVVLGPHGRCILIDFGSSGLVKKSGWDTFSGTLDYAGPEILRGERYFGKEQDVWAFGVVAYVLLVGECPFENAAEAQEGLRSPFAKASIALEDRCGDDNAKEGLEPDGGGALGDAAALVRECLQVEVGARPTFERILQSRFLSGGSGWGA